MKKIRLKKKGIKPLVLIMISVKIKYVQYLKCNTESYLHEQIDTYSYINPCIYNSQQKK